MPISHLFLQKKNLIYLLSQFPKIGQLKAGEEEEGVQEAERLLHKLACPKRENQVSGPWQELACDP